MQLRLMKGELSGTKGIFVPYLDLARALEIPEGLFFTAIIDYGDEFELCLQEEAGVSSKDGLFRVLPNSRSSRFIKKDAFLELLSWPPDRLRVEFYLQKPGWPLIPIYSDILTIFRNRKQILVWFEEYMEEPSLFKEN
jgi:hypothetical protein